MNEKILNSIKLGALCDALGYPLEFDQNPQDIKIEHPLEFSDDTQMTLFTMEGLTQDDIEKAMLDWYHTQIQSIDYNYMCWFYGDARMHRRKYPGNTCLSSMKLLNKNQDKMFYIRPENDSKGNGALIRSAPFGFINKPSGFFEIHEHSFCESFSNSQLTHDHMLSKLSCGTFAMILSLVSCEYMNINNATRLAIEYLHSLRTPEYIDGAIYLADLLDTAIYLANNDDPFPYDYLGEGWVAEECLALAIYSALVYEKTEDFDKALKFAICHKGDSDSVGSVFGNLVGLIIENPNEVLMNSLGISLDDVDCSDIIDEVVYDFCEKFQK